MRMDKILKIGYMCHNAYWFRVEKEGSYMGCDVDTFGSLYSYFSHIVDVDNNLYDLLLLFNSRPFSCDEMKKLENVAKEVSSRNSKKVTVAYTYGILMDKRIDNNTYEVQMISFYDGKEDRYTTQVNSDFEELDLLNQAVEYHNKKEKESFYTYKKTMLI